MKKEFAISSKQELLGAVRSDASREYCSNKIEKVDFETHSLIGIAFNSGYCRRPTLLLFDVEKVESEKVFRLNVSYFDPMARICRGLSKYDLWVVVPKIPDGFDVKFEVTARPQTE